MRKPRVWNLCPCGTSVLAPGKYCSPGCRSEGRLSPYAGFIVEMRNSNVPICEIANRLGVTYATVNGFIYRAKRSALASYNH